MGELRNPCVHQYFREDYFNEDRGCFLPGGGTIYRRHFCAFLEKGRLEVMEQKLKMIMKESGEVQDTLFLSSMTLLKYYQVTHFMWEDCVVDKAH